jgi:hypothetical protein
MRMAFLFFVYDYRVTRKRMFLGQRGEEKAAQTKMAQTSNRTLETYHYRRRTEILADSLSPRSDEDVGCTKRARTPWLTGGG